MITEPRPRGAGVLVAGSTGDITGPDALAWSTGWVARRLGVAPTTLRTWHRRYEVGPTGRSPGGHRRYLAQDVERLDRMRRLVLAGVPTAEAARAVAGRQAPRRAAPARAPGAVRKLTAASMRLDEPAVQALLTTALYRHGIGPAWGDVVVPVLARLGARFALRGDCVDVEHLFTEAVRTALGTFTAAQPFDAGLPPVLLACLDQERHSLPLHALAAALAAVGRPSRVLGASVPADALASAVRRITPSRVFVWAQTAATARVTDLPTLPSTLVVVGGPGWRDQALPHAVLRVASLSGAVAALSADVAGAARCVPA